MKHSEHLEKRGIFDNIERPVALCDPQADEITKLHLVISGTVCEISDCLAGWCDLLITTLDMLIEVASGFVLHEHVTSCTILQLCIWLVLNEE
jgi:hypothetical protein